MSTYAFYSVGGFAREVRAGFARSSGAQSIVFIDDDVSAHGQIVQGCRVISYEEARTIKDLVVNVAFADPTLRKIKTERCMLDGMQFFSAYSPSTIIGDNVQIGEGAIFAHNSIVTSDATIGRAFHCNIFSYVAHDCEVGDFVTFAPKVCMNGRVKIEDRVYVGTGAIILPGKRDKYITIGEGSIIGAGAVVTKDVEPGSVMIGSPARPKARSAG